MNRITMQGYVLGDITFSHEFQGEHFYKFEFSARRMSEEEDTLMCIIPEMFLEDLLELRSKPDGLMLVGEVRTRNGIVENKRKHIVYVFVKCVLDYEPDELDNFVEIQGVVCKKPVHRTTPGGREICDLLIASNRMTNWRSDYLPCIAWGRSATYASRFGIGTKVVIEGRLQSRDYVKRLEDGTRKTETAYEVSVKRINAVESEGNANERKN